MQLGGFQRHQGRPLKEMGGPQRQLGGVLGVKNEIELKQKWSFSRFRMADLWLFSSNLLHK